MKSSRSSQPLVITVPTLVIISTLLQNGTLVLCHNRADANPRMFGYKESVYKLSPWLLGWWAMQTIPKILVSIKAGTFSEVSLLTVCYVAHITGLQCIIHCCLSGFVFPVSLPHLSCTCGVPIWKSCSCPDCHDIVFDSCAAVFFFFFFQLSLLADTQPMRKSTFSLYSGDLTCLAWTLSLHPPKCWSVPEEKIYILMLGFFFVDYSLELIFDLKCS